MSEPRKEIGSVQLTQDMPNGRKMAVMFAILDGDKNDTVSAQVDGYMNVLERARVKCEIPILEFQLNQKKDQLAQQIQAEIDLMNDAQAGRALKSFEKAKLQTQFKATIKGMKEQIEKGEKEIAEKKASIED